MLYIHVSFIFFGGGINSPKKQLTNKPMIPMALTNLKELELFIIFRAIAVCDAPQLVKERKRKWYSVCTQKTRDSNDIMILYYVPPN